MLTRQLELKFLSHSRESCEVEEENKWQRQWRISKMEIDSVPRQHFPIGKLKNFLTSDASSSSMSLSLAVLLLLAWVGLVSRVDQQRTALHLESRIEKYPTQDCPKCGSADEDLPHGSRGPMWLYGGLRSGCMECAAAGGCLVPVRSPQLCTHPLQTGYDNLL